MKKFLLGLIMLVFVFGFIFAQTEKERKSEEVELLTCAEKILLHKKADVEEFVSSISKDREINKSELLSLKEKIKNFFNLKEDLEKTLGAKVFKDNSRMIFIVEGQKAMNEYFPAVPGIWFKDYSGEVKDFFTKNTGKEVEIKKGKDYFLRVPLVIFLILIVLTCTFIYCDATTRARRILFLLFSVASIILVFLLIFF